MESKNINTWGKMLVVFLVALFIFGFAGSKLGWFGGTNYQVINQNVPTPSGTQQQINALVAGCNLPSAPTHA